MLWHLDSRLLLLARSNLRSLSEAAMKLRQNICSHTLLIILSSMIRAAAALHSVLLLGEQRSSLAARGVQCVPSLLGGIIKIPKQSPGYITTDYSLTFSRSCTLLCSALMGLRWFGGKSTWCSVSIQCRAQGESEAARSNASTAAVLRRAPYVRSAAACSTRGDNPSSSPELKSMSYRQTVAQRLTR